MLTRLNVNGFKNLVDVDVSFGPFTCVAGVNGVGKSNLFDAIRFLSALADRPLMDAALVVRDEEGRTADIRDLFHRMGGEYDPRMTFEAEMLIPAQGYDDLGQQAEASATFLHYVLELEYKADTRSRSTDSLALIREELTSVNLNEARQHLLFDHKLAWRKSIIGRRREQRFISTEGDKIKLHQDGNAGKHKSLVASTLPRTVLSASSSVENPTALLARREMQSWRLLQLEPAMLRRPDELGASTSIGSDGAHLPSMLFRLATREGDPEASEQVYGAVANRLSELIDDVRDISVVLDLPRALLTLYVTDRNGTTYPARSLSDGTLRFLALSVMEADPNIKGLLCMEEPENGIHPGRIPAMIRLLYDIATDPTEPIGDDNPLRQVIVNTHSPVVVQQVPDDALLIADLQESVMSGQKFKHAVFNCLPDTWREQAGAETVSKGTLLAYLNPTLPAESRERDDPFVGGRVIDRPDLQMLLPLFPDLE